jgi:hypothetical protein
MLSISSSLAAAAVAMDFTFMTPVFITDTNLAAALALAVIEQQQVLL